MANPYDPFGQRSRNPYLPDLPGYGGSQPTAPFMSPEEQSSALANFGHRALEGVGYLGASLAKPRRALWGLLGGLAGQDSWREALNVIPFSDAMGITRPEQEIRGSHLLGGNDDTPFFSGAGLGGAALEILGDPLLFTGLLGGANTIAGQAAKAAGMTLPKTGAARYGTTLGQLAQNAPQATRTALDAALAARGSTLAEQAASRLGGHAGFGLPFGLSDTIPVNLAPVGNALRTAASYLPGAQTAGRVASAAGEALAPYGRAIKAAFQPEMEGQLSAVGQRYGPMIHTAREAGQQRVAGEVAELVRLYGDDVLTNPQELRQLGEKTLSPAAATPGGLQAFSRAEQLQTDRLARAQAAGIDVGQIENYWGRQVSRPELDVAHAGPSGKYNPLSPFAESMIGREEILDVPGMTDAIESMVKDPFIGTAARQAKTHADAAAHIMQNYGIATPEQATGLANFLYSLHPERQRLGLFSRAALTDYQAMSTHLEQATAVASTATKFLAGEASSVASPGAKTLRQVLREMNLTPQAEQNVFRELQQLGRPLSSLDNLYVPREVADAVVHGTQPFSTPQILQTMLKPFDAITNMFRGLVTSPFPAFHARNAVDSLVWRPSIVLGPTEWVGAGMAGAKAIRGEAIEGIGKLAPFAGMTDDLATQALGNLAYKYGITGGGYLQDLPAAEGLQELLQRIPGVLPRQTGLGAVTEYAKGLAPRSLAEASPLGVRGVGERSVSTFAPAAAGEKLGGTIEDVARLGTFYGLLKKGYAPDVAAAMTKAAHIDYQNLTAFERQVMRRLIPFYSFLQGNVPWALRQIVERPGGATAGALKVAATARGKELQPQWLGSGAVTPLGEGREGSRRWLSSIGLSFENLGDLVSPGWLAGNLNPLLKLPIEMVSGRQLYSGRDMRDLHSRLGDLFGVEVDPWIENIIMNSPASRALTTAGQFVDPRKTWGDVAQNVLSGTRITDVPPASQAVAARRALESRLLESPAARTFERLYVPAEDLPRLSPEEAQLYQLYRSLEQTRRQQARQQQR